MPWPGGEGGGVCVHVVLSDGAAAGVWGIHIVAIGG